MKLRIRDNSIRLRLSQGEVERFRADGLLTSAIHFPGGTKIEYTVESSPASVKPMARYSNNTIAVRVPEATVQEWADSDRVSIASEQVLDDGGVLSVLIEKDFACLTPREGEDESDMFPHPEAGRGNC
ncbi:MAG: hypothetical protein OEW35_13950 [Gammaproteobacteria bacterium]|nr:hypothetical protein [Gammaproteobacteria bacterium]MDH4254797.1 hypothetical protein [Gammaproteobacteria bacterium]MDH5310793.1 hypothetical protein [Gammaproteobacteria bacterium]